MEALSAQSVELSHCEPLSFSEVYGDFFHKVERWSYAMGCPESDLGDVAQEVFLVVRRKLAQFSGPNLAGWLYRITARKVKDHRRRAWFRRWFSLGDSDLEDSAAGPEESYEKKQAQAALRRILDGMSEKRRTAFTLFELEGYSGQEIAELFEIPLQTVFTRLHHARRDFLRLLAAAQREGRWP